MADTPEIEALLNDFGAVWQVASETDQNFPDVDFFKDRGYSLVPTATLDELRAENEHLTTMMRTWRAYWTGIEGVLWSDPRVQEGLSLMIRQLAAALPAEQPATPETWGRHRFVPHGTIPDRCAWTDGRWSACKAPEATDCHIRPAATPETEASPAPEETDR